MNRGYLFYAIGDYWLDEAINLSKSIRKYGNDKYPISLVIKDDGIRKAKETNLKLKKSVCTSASVFAKGVSTLVYNCHCS